MKKTFILILILSPLIVFPFKCYNQGFSGSINFRDGSVVKFNYLGFKGDLKSYEITGYLGDKQVKYDFYELKEIIFAEAGKNYDNNHGEIIVIDQKEERLALTDAFLNFDHIMYVYNDPISKNELLKIKWN